MATRDTRDMKTAPRGRASFQEVKSFQDVGCRTGLRRFRTGLLASRQCHRLALYGIAGVSGGGPAQLPTRGKSRIARGRPRSWRRWRPPEMNHAQTPNGSVTAMIMFSRAEDEHERSPKGGVKFPANSLLFVENSLLGVQKFPAPLRREFGCKPMDSRAEWRRKLANEPKIFKNSLQIPWTAPFG